MKLLDSMPFEPDMPALLDKLHLPPESDAAAEFKARCRDWSAVCRPKAVYDECFVDDRDGDAVVINGVRFESPVLGKNLADVHKVYPYVATCGAEIDGAAVPETDFLVRFWHDAFKAAALTCAVDGLKAHIDHVHRPGKLASMNPGASARHVWAIEQQKDLFGLLGDVSGTCGVTLTPSFLMVPNKSLSGIYFASQWDFENCGLCKREPCAGRPMTRHWPSACSPTAIHEGLIHYMSSEADS